MKFRFSGILLRFVDYDRTVQIHADALGAALDQLEKRHPRLRAVLRDANGRIHRHHQIFLNGEQVTDPNQNLPLKDSDQIDVLTAIAGGSGAP